MTFFSHPLYFVCLLPVSILYHTFQNQKPLFQDKKFLLETFFLVRTYFASHPITVLLRMLGGRMHGPSSTSNLGALPSSPSQSLPVLITISAVVNLNLQLKKVNCAVMHVV